MPLIMVGICLGAAYLALMSVRAYLCVHYKRSSVAAADHPYCEVTIVQPILSGDPLLEETLRHNVEEAPKWARFLWLIDDGDHTALGIARSIIESTEASVVVRQCPDAPQGVNPKSFKLDLAVPGIRTSHLLVLDDDTKLTRTGLDVALTELESAEVYTGLAYYEAGSSFWSSLVAHFVNNNSILTYLPMLNFVDATTLNGMYYAMKKDTLLAIGGFSPILDQVSDDHAMAQLVLRHGGRIAQGVSAHGIRTSVESPRAYFRIMHRWFVFAAHQVTCQRLGFRALLMLTLATPSLLLWAGCVALAASGAVGLLVLAALLLVRDQLYRSLHGRILGWTLDFRFVPSVLAELLQPVHLAHALVSKRFYWRSRRIQMYPDGRFRYLDPLRQ